jgi:hypothetical protein
MIRIMLRRLAANGFVMNPNFSDGLRESAEKDNSLNQN